eukprot:TRINITY_DN24934_c0_g1_i1.p1 TRINITY_DN24934_c0_g1~~TRINITY_DN24934_c0_g1_i1.p1  ORF type:complete len:126 (+),score=18.19 TRINITY_DN24934_c0_g1_i1:272-649(+)
MQTISAEPKAVLTHWVELFNAADADRLAELYAANAVNHQVMFDPVEGRDAIRERFREEFAAANMHCQVENMFGDGQWAIMEWRDPTGLRGCGFFQIIDGLIVFQRGYWDRRSAEAAFSAEGQEQQ